MRVRSARPEDAPALGFILSNWIDETPWMPRIHTQQEDEGFVTHLIKTQEVLVAIDPDPLGFLAIQDTHITALYLKADARGQGVGTALLDRAKSTRNHLSLWTFQANEGAQQFYLREGFTTVARTDGENEEGLPDLKLEWNAAR